MSSQKHHTIDRLLRLATVVTALLLVVLLVLTVVLLALKTDKTPAGTPGDNQSGDVGTNGGADTQEPAPEDDGVTLPLTEDAGIAYQDSLTFVGDSLTAHLINRGVLTDGTNTKQVWRSQTNMINLNSQVTSAKIILPSTGELMTIAEAAKAEKPSILIITLGTDWGVAYLNETDFKDCYSRLIKDIQKASPETTIILQSIFPVTASCTLLDNAKIDNANRWVKAIAADNGCAYLDTQSILKDQNNCLKEEYCNSSDGIHLGKNAYEAILQYIRTHAVTE